MNGMNALNQTERDEVLASLLGSIKDFTDYVVYLTGISSVAFTAIFAKLTVDLRRREFAILRSIGAKPRTLYIQYLSELGMLGLLSATIGMIGGIITSSIALFNVHENARDLSELWAVEKHILQSIPWFFPIVVLVGLVFGAGGLMIFLLNKKSIIEILSQ